MVGELISDNINIDLKDKKITLKQLLPWDIDQMKPLSASVVLSLFTPSFRRSTASSAP